MFKVKFNGLRKIPFKEVMVVIATNIQEQHEVKEFRLGIELNIVEVREDVRVCNF